MKRIAIIPARGGSKRIPHKNLKSFCGKPMISYPIQALLETNLFDKIHVSTDEKKVVEITEKQGVKVDFYRPKNLSDDYTPIMPVLKYVVKEFKKRGQTFDEVWVILPCSPMLNAKDLIKASIRFKEFPSSNSLMSVTEYPVPIEWAFETNDKGVLQSLNNGHFATRSQDLKKRYYDAGMFYIYTEKVVSNAEYDVSNERIIPYFIPKGKAIDIDDIEDWEYAEKLFKVN
jgi:N-acylneuraminate cytidylyltransferase